MIDQEMIQKSFTGFYRVLSSGTGFYKVLPDFYWVSHVGERIW